MRKTRKSIYATIPKAAYRAILVALSRSGYDGTYTPIQIGGGTVEVNGFRYRYRDIEGGVTIIGGRVPSKRPCFILLFDTTTAILQSIESGYDCSLDQGATSKHTVLAVAHLAKERGATRLMFTDNSTKYIAEDTYFRLSNMYFLTTGKTWYESILPCQLVVPHDAVKIEKWRQRVITNTWNTVYTCLKKEFPFLDIQTGLDGESEGSAMRVLHSLKTDNTDFFAKYEAELLNCSGIGSLHGLDWVCNL